MVKEREIELDGVVTDVLPNTMGSSSGPGGDARVTPRRWTTPAERVPRGVVEADRTQRSAGPMARLMAIRQAAT